MTTKQSILWVIVGLVVIIGLSFFGYSPNNEDQNRVSLVSNDKYLLQLDYGDGKVRNFSGSMSASSVKAWDLLQQASSHSSFEVKIENGFLPLSIDGIENNENKKWTLYVNGIRQNKKPFEVMVERGDIVSFQYE